MVAGIPCQPAYGKMKEDQNDLREYGFEDSLGKDFSERLNNLQKAILDSYDGKKYERQELLNGYQPKAYKQKKTYAQPSWHIYDQASRKEKLMFLTILKTATDHLNLEFNYKGNGRPKVDLKDIIKCLCIKTYSSYSSWRAGSELKLAKAMGVIDHDYKRSTLVKYLSSPEITPYLHLIYKTIAQPIKPIELSFSVDATGISQFNKSRWINVREDKSKHKDYAKIHIVSGNKTNIVCSAKVTRGSGKGSHESPHFKELIDDTAKIFAVKEVMADAGYLSRDNADTVSKLGAIPYIMPKKNVKSRNMGSETGAWGRMIHLWKKYRIIFAYHYHQRSNVESTFWMIKRKFGYYVRAKLPEAQENEVLTKIICHNIAVLAEAMMTYDISPEFMVN